MRSAVLTCFWLVSPVNTVSRIAPPAHLCVYRPQNLSCGEIHGGAGSLLRTSLYTKFPVYQGIYREFCLFWRRNEKSDSDMINHSNGLQRNSLLNISGNFLSLSGNLNHGTGNYQTRSSRTVPWGISHHPRDGHAPQLIFGRRTNSEVGTMRWRQVNLLPWSEAEGQSAIITPATKYGNA